jgi:hypothetical protein
MTGPVAEQTLRAVISWGRYAGAFAFDDEKNAAQPWKTRADEFDLPDPL